MDAAVIIQIRACTFVYPATHPEGPGTGELLVYAIRAGAHVYLVDTGIGVGHERINERYQPTPFDLLGSLELRGIRRADVQAIVCSHLHFDHCGNNRLFPEVPIYVQRAEYEAAGHEGYTVPQWLHFPDANYILLDGPTQLAQGIEILSTPGHTRGHQSVSIATTTGLEIVVAQAAYTAKEFAAYARPDPPPTREDAWSKPAYDVSLRQLHALNPQRAYFSHDATVWRP